MFEMSEMSDFLSDLRSHRMDLARVKSVAGQSSESTCKCLEDWNCLVEKVMRNWNGSQEFFDNAFWYEIGINSWGIFWKIAK